MAIAYLVGFVDHSTRRYPPTKQEQQQYAAAEARYTDAVAGNLSEPTANYSAYPDKNAGKCYYADDHDSADLCAQWRAALAAEEAAKAAWGAFWLGIISTVLSAFGLGALYYSLRQTDASLRQTREGNELSAQQYRDGFKPWLTIHAERKFLRGPDHAGPDYCNDLVKGEGRRYVPLAIRLTITNITDMPASIIRCSYRIQGFYDWTTEERFKVLAKNDSFVFASEQWPKVELSDDPGAPPTTWKADTTGSMFVSFTQIEREEIIDCPPPIEMIVIYEDPLGIRRELGFAFVPRQLWGLNMELHRFGGKQMNFDRVLTEQRDKPGRDERAGRIERKRFARMHWGPGNKRHEGGEN